MAKIALEIGENGGLPLSAQGILMVTEPHVSSGSESVQTSSTIHVPGTVPFPIPAHSQVKGIMLPNKMKYVFVLFGDELIQFHRGDVYGCNWGSYTEGTIILAAKILRGLNCDDPIVIERFAAQVLSFLPALYWSKSAEEIQAWIHANKKG